MRQRHVGSRHVLGTILILLERSALIHARIHTHSAGYCTPSPILNVSVFIIALFSRASNYTDHEISPLPSLPAFRTGVHKIADYAIADGAIAYHCNRV